MDAPRHDAIGHAHIGTSRTPQEIRNDIYAISADLEGRVSDLRSYASERLGSLHNPLHVRERMQARPLLVCSGAMVAGACIGFIGTRRAPIAMVRGLLGVSKVAFKGLCRTVGAELVSATTHRVMDGG